MRPLEIEGWVLRIADNVAQQGHVEDSRVELKSQWPDPISAARQIAAHANAARGAPILWVVGIDEAQGVRGADPQEIANWFPAVRSRFGDTYPELLHDLNVNVGENAVVALLFDTQRAPYLVKNPVFGQQDGGPVEWEVPWREGRKTRTATRADLVRLISPLILLPEIECLEFSLAVHYKMAQDGTTTFGWQAVGYLYVAPATDSRTIVVPFHRCSASVMLGNGSTVDLSANFSIEAPEKAGVGLGRGLDAIYSYKDSVTVQTSSSEAVFTGPGRVKVQCSTSDPTVLSPQNAVVTFTLRLHVVGASAPAIVPIQLQPSTAGDGFLARWTLST